MKTSICTSTKLVILNFLSNKQKQSTSVHEKYYCVSYGFGLIVFKAGFYRAAEGSGVSAQIQGLLDGGGSWDRNSIGSVLEEAMTRFAVMQRQTEERFRVWMEKLTRLDSDDSGDSSIHSSDAPVRHCHRAPRPSPPSSFLPSSESQETMAAYMLARENANITMNSMSPDPLNNNNNVLPDVVPVATQNGNPDISDPGLLKL